MEDLANKPIPPAERGADASDDQLLPASLKAAAVLSIPLKGKCAVDGAHDALHARGFCQQAVEHAGGFGVDVYNLAAMEFY